MKEERERALPPQYERFKELFEARIGLPEHGPHDHAIPLVEGKELSAIPMRQTSLKENEEMKKYCNKMLAKGYIWNLKLPVGHSIV